LEKHSGTVLVIFAPCLNCCGCHSYL